jgi:hypothetical protein
MGFNLFAIGACDQSTYDEFRAALVERSYDWIKKGRTRPSRSRGRRMAACPSGNQRQGEPYGSPWKFNKLSRRYIAGLKTANCRSSHGLLGQSAEQPPFIELTISLALPGTGF